MEDQGRGVLDHLDLNGDGGRKVEKGAQSNGVVRNRFLLLGTRTIHTFLRIDSYVILCYYADLVQHC